MAESLLLPWVQGLIGKAADGLVQSVTHMWGVDNHRRKLERQLVYVRSLLADAEEKAEARTEAGRAVKAWMKKLKAAAYEADDVLDDFHYEALHREAQAGEPPSLRRVLYFLRNRTVFYHKASRDLKKVLDKIDELVAEMNSFGLLERAEAPRVLYQQTYSALDESLEIFGRDDDKEVAVKLLLDQKDQQNVQVLPIIGMGGLGKTTLAKMVYNDRRVQNHFELKMWHCVCENFEATAIVRSVIQLAGNEKCDLPDNKELLQRRLQEAIGRKMFLLILDDVWNEDQQKWEDDLKPLLCSSNGRSGSMIVVTSRSQKVASIMGTHPPHELTCLSEDDSWELFSKKAFSKGVQEQRELITIGKRIVNRCKGLPLALKTLGGLMSSMHQVQEWETIAESNIGDTVRGKDEVLPILKLSYRHLSSEMKQCFAFCAVFPKDYEMEKDKLIQLWIANGFILEEGVMDLAQKGEFVFNELAWRSFLQDVNVKKFYVGSRIVTSYNAIGCKMHDLMHDLAKDVTGESAYAMDLIQKKTVIQDVHHMQISSYELEKINGLLKGATSLRTLLTQSAHLSLMDLKLLSLRALCCMDPSIIDSQLIYTTHLRYLELSGSNIVRLPNSVCKLYNLLSLRLNGCKELQKLPEGMTALRKLNHLYLLNCDNMEQMPPKLSLLHNLCTLTMFVVGSEYGCGIEELKNLRQLSHKLELYKLKNVKSGSKANLHEKRIRELLLDWDHTRSDVLRNDEANKEEEVLESLVPPGELEILEIRGYHGLAISQWMRDPQMFQCLRSLIISDCPRCMDIPIVWLSSSLEDLHLAHMDSLTTLCKNIDVEAAGYNSSPQVFPRLKRMRLFHLPNLERWIESNAGEPHSSVMFPELEELEVIGCRKLASLPEAPMLTRVSCVSVPLNPDFMFNYSAEGFAPISMPLGSWPSLAELDIGLPANVAMCLDEQQGQSQTSLENLRILRVLGDDAFVSIINLPKLQLGLGEGLAFVEELCITDCFNIGRWPVEELRYLPRLRLLLITSWAKLEGISFEEILSLPLLKRLIIADCGSLREIHELPTSLEQVQIMDCRSLVALPDGMDGLTSLEELWISGCPGIEEFPQGLLQQIPNLKSLAVVGCSVLERRCREGGEYFDLFSSIPKKNYLMRVGDLPRRLTLN